MIGQSAVNRLPPGEPDAAMRTDQMRPRSGLRTRARGLGPPSRYDRGDEHARDKSQVAESRLRASVVSEAGGSLSISRIADCRCGLYPASILALYA